MFGRANDCINFPIAVEWSLFQGLKIFSRTLVLCGLLLCLFGRIGRAQQPQPDPAQQPVPTETAPPGNAAHPSITPASGDAADDHRMFKVLPNYKTVNDPSQPVAAISTGDKFKLVLHYFDPFTYGFTAIQASIQQATNSPSGYGQGATGYAKRYGADFTDAFTNEFFTVGVFPTLFREDPRYFRKGTGGGLKRTAYAISRIFVTRTDAGTQRYNFSEICGNLASGSISNLYYPRGDRRVADIFTRTGFQMGYDSMFNVLKEFYPDLKRKFRRK